MKKVFSMFLILIMILPLLPANAQDSSCLIEFDGANPSYSMSGTHAFISGHHNDNAITASYGDTTGWVLNPTEDKTAQGYGYQTICINLPNSYMNNLSGTQDVLMDVRYYDGAASDSGRKFCVYYDSKNHYHETAGIVTLTGSGTWKTHTFTLEKPRLRDIGNTPLMNIGITVSTSYMTSEGSVTIASANVYWGEERDLFFTLDSENVGNIFFNSEPVILDMIFENPLGADNGEVTAELTLVNQLTDEEYNADKQISLGTAGTLTEQIDLSELNLPFGMYYATAEIYDGDTLVISDDTELSRLSAADNYGTSVDGLNNTFLGFNTHANEYSIDTIKDLVYLAKRSGVGFIRTTLGWEGVEKTAGQYVISEANMTLLNEAKKNNIKIMALLGNRNTGVYPDYKPWRTGSTEENFQNYLTKYSAFVTNVVSQLKDYVECWEIYNEYGMDYPNLASANDAQASLAAKDYSDILKAGYNAVKAVDPDAFVVGGVLDGNTSKQNFSLPLFSEYGIADYMDALSYHSYCSGSDASSEITSLNDKATRFNKYIGTYGDNQEVYLDEFNFTVRGGLSEEEQALYNVRFLTKQRYNGVLDRIYPYCLESRSYNIGSGYGFVDRPEDDYDYVLKTSAARPNYAALTFMNKLLRLSDRIDYTFENGNRIYEFYDNIHARPVYVIWNETTSDTVAGSVTIENQGIELVAYDMYGNELGSGDGSLTVTTGKKPVYVAGPEKDLHVEQDNQTYKVTVSGMGAREENISIVVLSKGTEKEQFTSVGQILYADQKRIDSTGVWEFTFKITQGNGEYTVLLAEENGRKVTYNLNYNAGNLRVTYELSQEQGRVERFDSLADGNLDINYRIYNPENKNTGFLVFGCLYKGDELVKVVRSPDGQLSSNELIKTGSITIPGVKKADIDKVQIMVFDGTDNIRPLVKKFVLE